jgi:hypothetical protein
MGNCQANVKICANPIIEYISRRICCQRFYDAPLAERSEAHCDLEDIQWAKGLKFGVAAGEWAAWGCNRAVVTIIFSEVGEQILSAPDGSGNQMISDMQVKIFLTREMSGLAVG